MAAHLYPLLLEEMQHRHPPSLGSSHQFQMPPLMEAHTGNKLSVLASSAECDPRQHPLKHQTPSKAVSVQGRPEIVTTTRATIEGRIKHKKPRYTDRALP